MDELLATDLSVVGFSVFRRGVQALLWLAMGGEHPDGDSADRTPPATPLYFEERIPDRGTHAFRWYLVDTQVEKSEDMVLVAPRDCMDVKIELYRVLKALKMAQVHGDGGGGGDDGDGDGDVLAPLNPINRLLWEGYYNASMEHGLSENFNCSIPAKPDEWVRVSHMYTPSLNMMEPQMNTLRMESATVSDWLAPAPYFDLPGLSKDDGVTRSPLSPARVIVTMIPGGGWEECEVLDRITRIWKARSREGDKLVLIPVLPGKGARLGTFPCAYPAEPFDDLSESILYLHLWPAMAIGASSWNRTARPGSETTDVRFFDCALGECSGEDFVSQVEDVYVETTVEIGEMLKAREDDAPLTRDQLPPLVYEKGEIKAPLFHWKDPGRMYFATAVVNALRLIRLYS